MMRRVSRVGVGLAVACVIGCGGAVDLGRLPVNAAADLDEGDASLGADVRLQGDLRDFGDVVPDGDAANAGDQDRPEADAALPPDALAVRGRFFETGGKRTLLVGDSLTQGWMELGTDFNQGRYLDALAARGINALLIWAFVGVQNQLQDSRIGYDSPEIWPWVRVNGRFDLTRLRPGYFTRLRAFVAAAAARDIIVVLTLHDGWTKTRFGADPGYPGHPFNAQSGGPLADNNDYVVLADYEHEISGPYAAGWSWQRKNQFFQEQFVIRVTTELGGLSNVVYEIFNEGEWYDRARIQAHQAHFLSVIRRRSAAPTLVDSDFFGELFRGNAECSALSYHMPNWDTASTAKEFFDAFAAHFNATPAKPAFFTEPVPEYRGDVGWLDAATRMIWGTALAGANVVFQNDTSFGFAPNAKIAAYAAARDAALDREGRCAAFFTDHVDLSGMRPRPGLTSTGVCLAAAGREYVIYSQSGATFTVNLTGVTGAFAARFYNPKTGQLKAETTVQGGAVRTITKPSSSDWVYHLVKRP
ncbi:MAG: hypothetical protein HY903_19385 [Deltaproteobacteria bacterium]|nr:hypothetical protein [Deltaproteobacteria bacterium]